MTTFSGARANYCRSPPVCVECCLLLLLFGLPVLMEQHGSIIRLLALGALETAINQAIALEPGAQARLAGLHGTVVRIRLEQPTTSIYLLLAEDGVEILHDYEGSVDVRVRSSLGALLQWLLVPGEPLQEHEQIRVSGSEPQLSELFGALQTVDLWHVLRHWFDQHVRLDDMLRLLRREDPAWLARLEHIGLQVDLIGDELGRQRLLQEEILDSLSGLKRSLRRERRLDLLFLSSGMSLLFAAFATTTGQLPVLLHSSEASRQALLFASLGLTLILSRILFGQRHV